MEKQITNRLFMGLYVLHLVVQLILWKKEKANHKSFVHGLFNWGDNFMEKQIFKSCSITSTNYILVVQLSLCVFKKAAHVITWV